MLPNESDKIDLRKSMPSTSTGKTWTQSDAYRYALSNGTVQLGAIIRSRPMTHGHDWIYYPTGGDVISMGRYYVLYNPEKRWLEMVIESLGPLQERITYIRVSDYLQAERLYAEWVYGAHFNETSEDNYGADYDIGC